MYAQHHAPHMRSSDVQWASGCGASGAGASSPSMAQGVQMQGVQGGRPPPISLSAGGGMERQGSNDPPQFMRALVTLTLTLTLTLTQPQPQPNPNPNPNQADMHCGTSPQQKMMQEQKRQEWPRQLNEQI